MRKSQLNAELDLLSIKGQQLIKGDVCNYDFLIISFFALTARMSWTKLRDRSMMHFVSLCKPFATAV